MIDYSGVKGYINNCIVALSHARVKLDRGVALTVMLHNYCVYTVDPEIEGGVHFYLYKD